MMDGFVMVSLISITLLPNSSHWRANLVRSSPFDGWPCSRNSCWAAKSPSEIFLERMVKACCTAGSCSAHNWGSWKKMKCKTRKGSSEWIPNYNGKQNSFELVGMSSPTFNNRGVPQLDRYPLTRKPQLISGVNNDFEIRKFCCIIFISFGNSAESWK